MKALTSLEEALSQIRSGDRVFIGSGAAEPELLVQALCARSAQLSDVELVHILTLGRADYVEPEHVDSFRHSAWFIGHNVRQAVADGRADYTPIFLSEIPELIRSGHRRVDVALISVSPADKHGYHSLGVHVDVQRAAIESARLVIAEINPNMPRTFGDTQIHTKEIHFGLPANVPILELPYESNPDEASIKIGAHVARLIEHGSCLQMGIGNIPNAVLRFLSDKRDLGIHTEMFSDGLLPLLQNGNITNRFKRTFPGKTVTSFVMGTRKLYDFIDDNPSVFFFASDRVNDPRQICRNDKVVAVNSAIQVDLTGQVCSDSIGTRFYSGIGGQVDFIRGAAMSKAGKPIIALPSTAKNGTVSRIVPRLDDGAGVVTSRGDVHYVVTEYGVAYLHGKSVRERALALIGIAHPDHRSDLLDYVLQRKYVYADEQLWRQTKNTYPSDQEHVEKFGELTATVRPLRATDERMLQEFFYSHRPDTIYNRYFGPKTRMGHREASELCCVDYDERMAFGVFEAVGRAERLIGIGRYFLNPRTNVAESAVVVHEDRRRLGIASHLIEKLVAFGKSKNISSFRAEIRSANHAMAEVHRRLGHQVVFDTDDQVYRVTF